MIFNSLTYLLFLSVAVTLYWILPRRPRLYMLLIASISFYGFWRWEYVPLMLLSAVVDYTVSLRLEITDKLKTRRALLACSLFVNLGLLAYFKYSFFFASNAVSVLGFLGLDIPPPRWSVVLPLGISFYTFQTISYTVDVYRRHRKATRDFVLYGCFVTFFPQLVAGPILRSGEVMDQLDQRAPFAATDLTTGFRRLVYGLFLKVVLADNIAGLVDEGFAQNTDMLTALDVWTLAFLFGFQIYFDFSAYSHIALGSARMMGIHLLENFNFPYAATSPKDFWKRWHISLSSWIRDYLYLPLCGVNVRGSSTGGLAIGKEPVSAKRKTMALFATWAIMGLWHGAAWAFVFWGLMHATYVWAHRKVSGFQFPGGLLRPTVGWLITLPLAMLTWISFRSQDLGNAFDMYRLVLTPSQYGRLGLRENTYLITASLLLLCVAAYAVHRWVVPKLQRRPWAFTMIEVPAMAVAIGLLLPFLRPVAQFIYFQF